MNIKCKTKKDRNIMILKYILIPNAVESAKYLNP